MTLVRDVWLELRLREELDELERRLGLAGRELDKYWAEIHSSSTKSGAISLGLSLGVKPDGIPSE
jgi:hypothetical protein